MATVRSMKENRQRRVNEKHANVGSVKPPLNPIQVGRNGGKLEESLQDAALNDIQAAYERVYRNLNTGSTSPTQEPLAEEEIFQPTIPIPIDKARFLPAPATAEKSFRKNKKGEVSVGNWTLEDVWRERGIPFSEASIEFPALETRGVNRDPNLSPEELRAFGLAPRSYDYLFENLEGELAEGSGSAGVSGVDVNLDLSDRTQPQPPPPPPPPPPQMAETWPSLEEVMKGMEGLNFSYFTAFPGDYLVVDHQGDVPHKPKKMDRAGRQTSGWDSKDSKYGR